jgi:hypothetical protein
MTARRRRAGFSKTPGQGNRKMRAGVELLAVLVFGIGLDILPQ